MAPLFALLLVASAFAWLAPPAAAEDCMDTSICNSVLQCVAGLEQHPAVICAIVDVQCVDLIGCCQSGPAVSCYVDAGNCGATGAFVTLFTQGTARTSACVDACGVGAGYSLGVGSVTSAGCVTACALPSVGVVVLGKPFCVTGVPSGPPGATRCTLYGGYPGQDGVVIDFPPTGPGGGDVPLCAGLGCPAATPVGLVVNNAPECAGAPTLCSLPGPGWTVGVGTTCVGAPWIGTTPALPGNPPSSCPGGTTIGITVIWGTTPVLGGPNYNAFCF